LSSAGKPRGEINANIRFENHENHRKSPRNRLLASRVADRVELDVSDPRNYADYRILGPQIRTEGRESGGGREFASRFYRGAVGELGEIIETR
jgi:hypothetical protein